MADFIITTNVAQKGDYKVKFASGDEGFLSEEKLKELFTPVPYNKNRYSPKKLIRRAVKLTKDVRMKAPWGTLHYASAGDYLVYIHESDCYFVPKYIFDEHTKFLIIKMANSNSPS